MEAFKIVAEVEAARQAVEVEVGPVALLQEAEVAPVVDLQAGEVFVADHLEVVAVEVVISIVVVAVAPREVVSEEDAEAAGKYLLRFESTQPHYFRQ